MKKLFFLLCLSSSVSLHPMEQEAESPANSPSRVLPDMGDRGSDQETTTSTESLKTFSLDSISVPVLASPQETAKLLQKQLAEAKKKRSSVLRKIILQKIGLYGSFISGTLLGMSIFYLDGENEYPSPYLWGAGGPGILACFALSTRLYLQLRGKSSQQLAETYTEVSQLEIKLASNAARASEPFPFPDSSARQSPLTPQMLPRAPFPSLQDGEEITADVFEK